MKNRELITLLGQFDPEEDVCLEVYRNNNELMFSTYAIEYDEAEPGQFVLQAFYE